MAIIEVYMGRWHHVCHLKQTQQICWNHGFQGCANNSDFWWTKFRVTRHGNEIHNSKCPNDWAFQELETLHQRMWTNCLLKCPTCVEKRVVAWGQKKKKKKKESSAQIVLQSNQSILLPQKLPPRPFDPHHKNPKVHKSKISPKAESFLNLII